MAPTHRSRDEDEILANLDLDAGVGLELQATTAR